ncbi:histone H1-like [Sitodiplosis mosellana]|uniref:histone H1-like n=1 Tax=Sitodiplosis mosellana TaxID=263140 RepID=UPI0024438BF4|nr:histone H1-like [Sitodiplosis mosellana]
MVETASVQVAAAPAPAKVKAPKAKRPASKPTHPPTATLVTGAIKALKERSGSSLQAIKKYIAQNDKVDADKLSPFIKKYLKKATASGNLVQTKGKGASGSFKLSAASLKPKVEKKKKKPVAKKAAGVKKAAGAKKVAKPKAKKTDKPKKKLAPKQKSLKPSKAKPKAPKPKKAQAKKPVTAAKKPAPKPAAK